MSVTDLVSADGGAALTFRGYRVCPATRRLLLGEREIPIGGRAFDLLVVLLRARGTVIDKTDLIRRIWPATVVDESNLRFQMSLLRKALGTDRDVIKTIARRGYLISDERDQPAVASECARSVDIGVRTQSLVASHFRVDGLHLTPQAEDPGRDSLALRLAELEQEYLRLKLAIADLALRHLSDDPWRRSRSAKRRSA